MADAPSGSRNFFGRVVDRILPGTNYNTNTGQYQNVGAGIAGLGARIAASAFLGPAAGMAVGKGAGYLIDRYGQPQISPVQREPISAASGLSVSGANVPIANMGVAANLGLPSVGSQWAGYTQGQGALNNFGNNQFGTGMATVPGSWAPASSWGQNIADRNPGSMRNFGNMSPGGAGAAGAQGAGGWSFGGATRGYSDTNRNFSLGPSKFTVKELSNLSN